MKTLKSGTRVKLNDIIVDVKEYVGYGVYQGNDIVTGCLVHFDRKEAKVINKKENKND